MEPVHHDPVEPGQRPHRLCRRLAALLHRIGFRHPGDHRLDIGGKVLLRFGIRLKLQDRRLPAHMEGDVEQAVEIVHDPDAEQTLDTVLVDQHLHAGADVVDRLPGQRLVEVVAEQIQRVEADIGRGIVGDLGDRPIHRHRDQESEELDPSRLMNGFLFALGLVDRQRHITLRRHRYFP